MYVCIPGAGHRFAVFLSVIHRPPTLVYPFPVLDCMGAFPSCQIELSLHIKPIPPSSKRGHLPPIPVLPYIVQRHWLGLKLFHLQPYYSCPCLNSSSKWTAHDWPPTAQTVDLYSFTERLEACHCFYFYLTSVFFNCTATHIMSSFLIIGAGNFGAATALSLARRGGGRKVTLVDSDPFPSPRAASHDVNKIVRDDYPDLLYMRMLVKAMPFWRHDPLYSAFYHQVGMLRADGSDFGQQSIAAYKAVGVANDSEYLPVEEVRTRWNGALATADFGELSSILYNPSVGYAEADKALKAVVQAAIDAGVEHVVGDMASLTFGPDGECTGIRLQSGETLQADKILLCTGARTGTLLAQSAPDNKKLHAGDRLLATGAVSFLGKLEGAQRDKFAPIPVLKNCLPQVKGAWSCVVCTGDGLWGCDLN